MPLFELAIIGDELVYIPFTPIGNYLDYPTPLLLQIEHLEPFSSSVIIVLPLTKKLQWGFAC